MAPLRVASVQVNLLCEQQPPSPLLGAWRTDLPADRVVFTVVLEQQSFVEKIALMNDKASHVEVRGSASPDVAWNRARELIPKTQLRSMWAHKESADGDLHFTLTPHVRCPEGAQYSYKYVLIALFNNWEPPTELGLRSVEIFGTADASPSEHNPPPVVVLPGSQGPRIVNPHLPYGDPVSENQPPIALGSVKSQPYTQPTKAPPSQRPLKAPAHPPCVKVPTKPAAEPPKFPAGGLKLPPPPPPPTKQAKNEKKRSAPDCDAIAKPLAGVSGGTHLICAYYNTPKYQEVMAEGKGCIVTKDWILAATATQSKPDEASFALKKKQKT
ncbi:hypothetical protein DIPPA_34964 [Diplonema papillatum]|nr:hypothetical protein DIPPA_34964 [Diplonema papillatum]